MEKHTVKGWIQLARPPVGVKKYEKIEFEESIKLAISAVDKQVPMKPRITPYEKSEGHSYSCKMCTGFVGNVCLNRWQNYCHNCGQRIDWSDVEPNGKLKEGVVVK